MFISVGFISVGSISVGSIFVGSISVVFISVVFISVGFISVGSNSVEYCNKMLDGFIEMFPITSYDKTRHKQMKSVNNTPNSGLIHTIKRA